MPRRSHKNKRYSVELHRLLFPRAQYPLYRCQAVQVVQEHRCQNSRATEYCGDVINFKTYSKSFRNKKRIENPEENWAVFKDVHEPIIDRDTFETVQELVAKTKRRAPKKENGEKNMFGNSENREKAV